MPTYVPVAGVTAMTQAVSAAAKAEVAVNGARVQALISDPTQTTYLLSGNVSGAAPLYDEIPAATAQALRIEIKALLDSVANAP